MLVYMLFTRLFLMQFTYNKYYSSYYFYIALALAHKQTHIISLMSTRLFEKFGPSPIVRFFVQCLHAAGNVVHVTKPHVQFIQMLKSTIKTQTPKHTINHIHNWNSQTRIYIHRTKLVGVYLVEESTHKQKYRIAQLDQAKRDVGLVLMHNFY